MTTIHQDQDWSFVIRFIEKVTDSELNMCLNKSVVSDYEAELNMELPDSVRQWLIFQNSLNELDSFSFRDDLGLGWVPDQNALFLLCQAEGDVMWSIRKQDFNCHNPSVYGFFLDYDSEKSEFLNSGVWAASIPCFALDYFLSYYVSKHGGCTVELNNINFENPKNHQKKNFYDLRILYNEDEIIFTNTNSLNWNFQSALTIYLKPRSAMNRRADTPNLRGGSRMSVFRKLLSKFTN